MKNKINTRRLVLQYYELATAFKYPRLFSVWTIFILGIGVVAYVNLFHSPFLDRVFWPRPDALQHADLIDFLPRLFLWIALFIIGCIPFFLFTLPLTFCVAIVIAIPKPKLDEQLGLNTETPSLCLANEKQELRKPK